MRRHVNRIQYTALIVLGFLIIGATSALSGEVVLERFYDPSYYLDLILTYLAIIFIISGIMIKAVMDFKEESQEYIKGEEDIKKFADATYRPLAFSKFCSKVNRVRKINQFKFNIQRQLTNMDYPSWWRRRFKIKKVLPGALLWERTYSDDMTDAEKKDLLLRKESNPYCRLRRDLLAKLDPDWIEKNIDNMEVEHDRINGSVILSGYYNKESNETPNDFIIKYKSAKIAKDRGPLLLLGFGIAALAGSIYAQFTFDGTWALNTLTKSLILVYQMFLTTRYAQDYNDRVTLHDIRFRKGNVKEYENWVKGEVSESELRKKEEQEIAAIKALKQKEELEKVEVTEDGTQKQRIGDLAPSN